MAALKKTVKELLKLPGHCRGATLIADRDFVLKKFGQEGLRKVEKVLEDWGVPPFYRDLEQLGFYPLGWRAISLLALKEALSLTEEQLEEIGRFSANFSLIVRLYFKFFHNLSLVAKKAPFLWREYYDIGSLEVINLDEKNKRVEITITDFRLHPLFCKMIQGYFKSIIKMTTGAKEVFCQEIACQFRGDSKHHFVCQWR